MFLVLCSNACTDPAGHLFYYPVTIYSLRTELDLSKFKQRGNHKILGVTQKQYSDYSATPMVKQVVLAARMIKIWFTMPALVFIIFLVRNCLNPQQ